MNSKKIMRRLGAVALAAALVSACDLDLTNPNSPTEEQVISNVDGVVALAVGMQGQFAQCVEDFIVPASLISDEWGTRTRSLLSYQSLFTGQNFENTYDVVSAPFACAAQITKSSNTLLAAAPNVGLGPAFLAGVTSLAKTFKAMALGYAAMIYEGVPVTNDPDGAPILPRAEVVDTVLALLESARADIANVSDADLAVFRSRVFGSGNGVNLRTTIDAMIARYALIDGQYQKAIDAATRVTTTTLSTINYPSPTTNPIWGLAISLQYVGGTTNFVSAAQTGDRRPNYWLQATAAPVAGNPTDSLSYTLRKYSTQNEPFPLYLPDELKLIRAEAQARLGNLQAARDLINEVRTQTSSTVDEPVAGLPALTATDLPTLNSILAAIAYERRYELYMMGLRWEDARRLPTNASTTFTFLPLPAAECRTNDNAQTYCD
jgi:starch-binding outer membrane protein, SusD/RagB family